MNVTFDRAKLLRCLAQFPDRRSKEPVPLRVIAGKDGLLLVSPHHREFEPAMVLMSGEFLCTHRLLSTALRIHRVRTLTLQAKEGHFRLGAIDYPALQFRATDEVNCETLLA